MKLFFVSVCMYLILIETNATLLSEAAKNGMSLNTTSVECCDLWHTLAKYIQTHSGIHRKECNPESCPATGQIQSFVSESNSELSANMEFNGSRLVIPFPTSKEMEHILIWAYMGRHFTSTRQAQLQDDFFFEFNMATRTMTLRKFQCEFQKPMYMSIVVLTIIVLIFIISSRMVSSVLQQHEDKTLPKSKSDVKAALQVNPASAIGMRYRALPLL